MRLLSPPWRIKAVSLCAATLLCLGACGGGGRTYQIRFLLASSTPRNNTFGVSVSARISATFNTPLDERTVAATTLTVKSDGDGVVVSGSSTLVTAGGQVTVRWKQDEPLAENTSYRCEIDPGLRGADGSHLARPTVFRFSTVPDPVQADLPAQEDLRELTARMRSGRQAHAALRLRDGRVLITGGYTIGLAITSRAELFSPSTVTFDETPMPMGQARAGHTMTRLRDGRILICGGYVPGVAGAPTTTASTEIYDPSANAFQPAGAMRVERADHAAVLLPDGTVLITGGSRLRGGFLEDHDTAEVFDPVRSAFRLHASPMLHTRATHGLIDVGNGRFVLGGGSDLDFRVSFFDTTRDAFVDIGAGASDRGRFGAMMARFASGAVILAGGDNAGTVMYIPREQGLVLNSGSALHHARAYGTATPIGPDRIFIAGGIDFTRGGFLEPSCDLVLEAGIGGSQSFATEVRFPVGMAFHTATVLADGRVLFLGGLNDDGTRPNLRSAFVLAP